MINQVLKDLRKSKGLKQEEVAELLNLPRYTISNWEQGRAVPSIENIKLLCVFYNITTDELLEFDTPISRKEIADKLLKKEK